MATRTAMHLCSGYGGFELALRNLDVRTVAHVERDSYAASILMERMAQKRLDQAPIYDDIETFDGAAWRGRAHLVTAGFSCQPFSAAGKRAGIDDERWIWPDIARIIGEVRPEYVFLENVPGLIRLGLPEVLDDLARLGFDAEWALLPASAVGAPHKRERVWIVAHANDVDVERERGEQQGRTDAGRNVAHVGHAGGEGRSEVAGGSYGDAGAFGRRPDRDHVSDGPVEDVADADDARREGSGVRQHEPAQCWPPFRDDVDGWAEFITTGGPQPVLRRDADGPPDGLADAHVDGSPQGVHRSGPPDGLADSLHLGGNGAVPQCARQAFTQLLERAGWRF